MTDTPITDVDLKHNQQAAFEDAIDPIRTAFNDMGTVTRSTIVSIQSSQGLSRLRDVIKTEGTGTDVDSVNTGELYIETGATQESSAILETAEFGQYTAGLIAQCGIGIRAPSLPTEDAFARWGYYDDINGFYFGVDSDGLFVGLKRDGNEIRKVYRDDWNGTDPDKVRDEGNEFHPAEGAIYQVDYAWYGYGGIEFKIVSANNDNEQKVVTVHRMTIDDSTSITNPNQPIRAEVDNNGTEDNIELFVGGRQYCILGDSAPNDRISSDAIIATTVANGDWTAVKSFRRKPDNDRRANARIKDFGIESDADIRVAYVLNPDIGGTPTWEDPELIPADETMFEFSDDAEFSGLGDGIKIWEGIVPVGAQGNVEGSLTLAEIRQIIPRDQPVIMIAQGLGSTAEVDAVIRVQEDW